MNIMIIGYEGEPASAYSSIYLSDLLKTSGYKKHLGISSCLISHTNGGAIVDGMFKTAIKNIRPDVVISINVPRFCFGEEFGAVKTFITWIQDWNIWMNAPVAKLWNDSLGVYNDWMIGYVNHARGFEESHRIHSPYLLPIHKPNFAAPEFDIVAPMNKGMGWKHWWNGEVCQSFLKKNNIDDSYMRLILPKIASDIEREVLPVLPAGDSIINHLGPAGQRWIESLPESSEDGKDRNWFVRVILENGVLASMFRASAIINLSEGMDRGNGTYQVAGLGWEWASSNADFISPQHIIPYMETGRYVLHVSHGDWGHHRTAFSFMAGRMPVVLAKENRKGAFGSVEAFLKGQEMFLRGMLENLPHGRPCPDFPMSEVECLGRPAQITMESLKNFKQWEKEYGI